MKIKICAICKKECYYWSAKLKACKDCAMRMKAKEPNLSLFKPRTAISKVSTHQAKINSLYKIQRDLFMGHNKLCQAQWEGCTTWATECHHALGRLGGNMLNMETYRALCHSCHAKVELDKPRALKEGLSGNRLDKQ